MLWLEIPAYAGSTRTSATPTGTAPDHPRIRGEHRPIRSQSVSRPGSSPHTRGAPSTWSARPARPGIIPAYAGSTAAVLHPGRSAQDHPRIRGEHHARLPARVTLRRIIPAYAGSTRKAWSAYSGTRDHPRIRGEHAVVHRLPRLAGGIIPAYAGSTLEQSHLLNPSRGSSPHTRGAPYEGVRRKDWFGIIPAYAGSTGRRRSSWIAHRDHPRIRGEHQHRTPHQVPDAGSSPHTRGARTAPQSAGAQPGIIPAYAGSTEIAAVSVIAVVWIIPAYAGSTAAPATTGARCADHPRIRGEHEVQLAGEDQPEGSSPHTRGARDDAP